MRVPLEYLRESGVVAAPAAVVPEGPVERLLDDYRRYLAGERGLVVHTIENHERVARLFLAERDQLGAGLGLEHLAAQDVSAFLASECPKRSVSGARDLIKGLRALLRYLHVAGVIATPLQWAVPAVAYRRDPNLPLGLSRADVARLLASCDRRRTVGRRDYAVLLLLARLGLRAGEVAAIELEDIDWHRGEFQVRGKGARLECQWPSSSPQGRPSVLPGGGHVFSPLAAMNLPMVMRGSDRRRGAEPVGRGERRGSL